jgi:oligosaccharyltransferase complex subunit alpha (ribophorin I)
MNNKPFAKFSTLARELEVSHWGNVAIEEIYELKHAGAKLKGGFSRFDYMMRRGGPNPSFRSLVASLPRQANNIYYRDQIGNISTSSLRMGDEDLELEIETRFPMFGGWQTQFYIGYSVPTEVMLFADPATGKHSLQFDFFTIFDDVWVEDMEIKVVLPEGCSDIKVNVPYAVEQSRTTRFTYLDSKFNGGRPVVIIKAKNIVPEHDGQMMISYTFNRSRMMVEPLMLVCSFFCFFLFCSVLARMGSDGKGKAKKSGAPGASSGAKHSAPSSSSSGSTSVGTPSGDDTAETDNKKDK